MSQLGSIIPISNEDKELYSKLNFKYFLNQNLKRQNISNENFELIKKGYDLTIKKIRLAKKENRFQFHLFIEGYVRKMHSGGMLGSHFNLGETRSFTITRFEDYGENWAYFETWSKRERKIRRSKRFWKIVVELGAVLGFALSALRVIEFFYHKK